MDKYKIVFLCHFSNPEIREKLKLKKYSVRNCINRFRGVSLKEYYDSAIWVSDYIHEFEKHKEFEFHIVSPHRGLRCKTQCFVLNDVYYHFFKCNGNYAYDYLNAKIHFDERSNYKHNRNRIKSFIEDIQPNLIILCGAENAYYSIGVLDEKKIPVYTILQTLLNDPKRIDMGIGTSYRRKIELDIFRYGHYFCTTSDKAVDKIKEVNKEAIMLPAMFPTHRPTVVIPDKKNYDFVFFAKSIKKNKGIEDVLQALSFVKKTYPAITLNIIGKCTVEYREDLDNIIKLLGLQENVYFSGFYNSIEDTYLNVIKANAAVLPGITAGLNSTVREAMFMGLPTVCYETEATISINEEKTCLLTAPMGNVDELARLMLVTKEKPEYSLKIATNGKLYAEKVYGNEAIVNVLLDNCLKIIEKKV